MWVTWHGGWGCWALYERERAGVGDVARQVGVLAAKRTRKGESDGVAHHSASWTLNERERADVGDVARRVGVLGTVRTREGGVEWRGPSFGVLGGRWGYWALNEREGGVEGRGPLVGGLGA